MRADRYPALLAAVRRRPALAAAVRGANRLLPAAAYLLYPLGAVWLLAARDPRLIRFLLVPGAVFVLGTVARRAFHAPRPYQLADYEPLVHRGKTDDSFPSRHVFSASVIAAAFWYVCPPLGALLTLASLLLAPARVLAGVHFPRDVLAGLAFGFGAGWLGCFVLLPGLP